MLIFWLCCMLYYVFVCFSYVWGFISGCSVTKYSRYVRIRTYCMYVEQKNCSTKIHKPRKKNVQSKLTKRNLHQTNQRPTRPHNPPIPKHRTHARIPSNNQNPQNLRRILRTKHHIPSIGHTWEKRLRRQPLEHEFWTTKKSLQLNKRRPEHAKLYRRLT